MWRQRGRHSCGGSGEDILVAAAAFLLLAAAFPDLSGHLIWWVEKSSGRRSQLWSGVLKDEACCSQMSLLL